MEAFLQRTGVGPRSAPSGSAPGCSSSPPAIRCPRCTRSSTSLRLEESGGYRAFVAFDEFQDIGRIEARRVAPEPHPAPRRGRLVRLRRLRAGADAAALRDEGAAALRLGGPDAAGAARRRETSRPTSPPASRRRDEASATLQPAPAHRAGPPSAGDAARAPPLGGVARGTDATLETGTRRTRRRSRSSSRSSTPSGEGSTSPSSGRCALLLGDGSPYRSAALRRLELTKDVVRRALPRLAATAEIEERAGAATRSSTRCSPSGSRGSTTSRARRTRRARWIPAGSPTSRRSVRSRPARPPAGSRSAGTGTTGR